MKFFLENPISIFMEWRADTKEVSETFEETIFHFSQKVDLLTDSFESEEKWVN